MADQASEHRGEHVAAVTLVPGSAHWRSTTRAGPISWVGVGIVIIGFIIGGIAFFPHPHWTIFWIGTAVAIVGCLIARCSLRR